MFRRRKNISIIGRIRGFLWPERGFRRLFSYLAQRVMRMPGSPASIATGLACGVGVSFTPFIGFHFFLGALLAHLMRGNILASAIGTVVGNPWTFPLIIIADYEIGFRILHYFGSDIARQSITVPNIMDAPAGLFIPWIVGGFILGLIAWFASFGMAFWAVMGWRQHRAKRLEAGARRRRERVQQNMANNNTLHMDGDEADVKNIKRSNDNE